MPTPRQRVTAIVAAMPEEVAPLRARFGVTQRLPVGGATEIIVGRWNGQPVALAVTGDGARNAHEGIAALFAAVEVERLIAVGVAGALTRDLAEGALVVASEVLQESGSVSRLRADETLVTDAARVTGAKRAVVMTAGRIADTAAEKQRLHGLVASATADTAGVSAGFGRETVSAVVDLESASYASAAAKNGVPWIILRAVSDTADEALPALLNRSRDEGGAVRRASVVRGLLGDPGVLPALLGLRRRVQRCAGLLSQATIALLTAPVPVHRPSLTNHGEGEEPALGSQGGI